VAKAFRISGKSNNDPHLVKFCRTLSGLLFAIETDTTFYLKNSAKRRDLV
jgi:hypothetical protein